MHLATQIRKIVLFAICTRENQCEGLLSTGATGGSITWPHFLQVRNSLFP